MKCLEIARLQDFASNIQRLLGALRGLQTPAVSNEPPLKISAYGPGTIWIYKNSQKLTEAYSGNIHPQYKGVSASAAVWLDVGDQVYLRPRKSLYVYGLSSFTGAKVN